VTARDLGERLRREERLTGEALETLLDLDNRHAVTLSDAFEYAAADHLLRRNLSGARRRLMGR
jgi:hypothetical protein